MKVPTLSALIGCFVIAACAQATPPLYNTTATFDPAEVAWAEGEGTSSISGSSVIRTVGGEIRTCAGNKVLLIPSSSYAQERMNLIYGNLDKGYNQVGAEFETDDPNASTGVRSQVCDSQGNFYFKNLPNGEFFVVSSIFWQIPSGQYSYKTHGGYLMERVVLDDNENARVVLAP